MSAALEAKRRRLCDQLAKVNAQIEDLRQKQQRERERKTPLKMLSELQTKKEVEELIKTYRLRYDDIKISEKHGSLESKIEVLTEDIPDCQCAIYYNVKTREFKCIEYEDSGSSELEMKSLDASDDWVQVFAK